MPKVRISSQTWLSNTTFQGKKGFLLPGFNYIYIFFSLNMQSSRKKLSPTVVPISIVQFQTDLAEGVCLTERRSCNFSDLARDAK